MVDDNDDDDDDDAFSGICSSTSHRRSGINCQQWLSNARNGSFDGPVVMIIPRVGVCKQL